MPNSIDRQTLKAALAATPKPVLIEALPEKYYAEGHLPGAINMPHDQVAGLAARLLPNRDRAIVVYCASATCRNSHIAAAALERLGYTDVSVYPGGKQDWREAGLPLERATAAA